MSFKFLLVQSQSKVSVTHTHTHTHTALSSLALPFPLPAAFFKGNAAKTPATDSAIAQKAHEAPAEAARPQSETEAVANGSQSTVAAGTSPLMTSSTAPAASSVAAAPPERKNLFAKATATLNLNSTGFGKKSGGFGGGSAGWVPPPSVPSPLLLDSPQLPLPRALFLFLSRTHTHVTRSLSFLLFPRVHTSCRVLLIDWGCLDTVLLCWSCVTCCFAEGWHDTSCHTHSCCSCASPISLGPLGPPVFDHDFLELLLSASSEL